MKVTIFTTRIKSSKLFDGDKSVSNPPATAKLNEFFRRSILLAALKQMEADAEQQKRLRDSIIESWLDKPHIDDNTTRQNLQKSILAFYQDFDNDGNDETIRNYLIGLLTSIPNSPFSFNDCFALGLLIKNFSASKTSIFQDHLLHLTDNYLKEAGINVVDNRSIFPVKVVGESSAKGVYGIECLDSANSSDEWIKNLLECAKLLEGAEDSPDEHRTVQLILHDKDLPNDFFGQHDRDVYVLNPKELDSLVPGWNANEKDQLQIAFFHHTTNELARLVQNPYDGKDIHDKVSTFIDTYFSKKKEVELKDDTLYQ